MSLTIATDLEGGWEPGLAAVSDDGWASSVS